MKFSFEISRSMMQRSQAVTRTGSQIQVMPTITPEHMRAYRQVDEWNRKMMRYYDAAVTNQYNSDLPSTFGSPNSEILTSLYIGRGRARTTCKDTPHGKAALRAFQNNVIGDDPFRLDMRIGDMKKDKNGNKVFVEDCDTNTKIEELWKQFGWSENFTVRKNSSRVEAFRVMEAAAVRDGSLLIRHYRGFKYNKFGYAIDLLENDRLQESYMGKDEEGNPIRFSISRHPIYNFPIYYWILTRHPGEVFGYTGVYPNTWREQVKAEDIIHYNNLRDRAEQDIGMTEFDATVQPLWRFHQWEKSMALAAIARNSTPLFFVKKSPTGLQITDEERNNLLNQQVGGPYVTPAPGPGSGSDPSVTNQGAGVKSRSVAPGQERELDYGIEAQLLDPKFPHEAAHHYRLDNLRDVAVGLGLSYQDITGDFQNLGFAAALMCQTPRNDYFKVRQNNFKDVVLRPIFREFLKACILKGLLDLDIRNLDDYVSAARFKAKRWAFVNPLVQAQTLIILLEAKVMSPQQVQDELPDGVSIEDLYTMIAEAKSEAENHGINIEAMDVTKPTIGKGEPLEEKPAPAETDAGQPPPKTRPANPVRSIGSNRIYVVRHGQTDWNGESGQSQDRIRGHLDMPLNDDGRVQAHKAGDRLQEANITRIFTSDLSRARETGEIIGERINAPIRSYYDLRPWNLGPTVQGQLTKEVLPFISNMVNRPDEIPPGGESFNQFKTRFFKTWNQLVASNQSRNVAFVLHYRNLKLLQSQNPDGSTDMGKFMGHRDDDAPGSVHQWNGSTLVDFQDPMFDVPATGSPKLSDSSLMTERSRSTTMRLIEMQGDGTRNGHS